MDKQLIKEELRAILNKPARELTADDKASVQYIADELKIEINPKRSCNSCWHDAAMQILESLKDDETEQKSDAKYVLKQGVDVYFGSVRVNEHTLTDEMAERIIARGFEKKYFAKCE